MQFQNYVVNRIPDSTKASLQTSRGLDFVWQGLPNSTDARNGTTVATRVLDQYGYCPPNEPRNRYFWDDYAYWDPLGGDPELNSSSVGDFVDTMKTFVESRAAYLEHNILLFPWGCDFEFQNATAMFLNMDVAVDYVNNNSDTLGFTLEYATLTDYFEAVRQLGIDFGPATRRDDFFPYATFATDSWSNTSSATTSSLPVQNWWTGEFTSYPLMKKLTRKGAAKLRATEQLVSASLLLQNTSQLVDALELVGRLRQASAEAQHHDAVDGTSPARVTKMWEDHLSHGQCSASQAAAEAVSLLTNADPGTVSANPDTFVNALASGHAVDVIVYNSLPFSANRIVSLCVPDAFLHISIDGASVDADVIANVGDWPQDHWPLPNSTWRENACQLELVFVVPVDALGFTKVLVEKSNSSLLVPASQVENSSTVVIANEAVRVVFDAKSGLQKIIRFAHQHDTDTKIATSNTSMNVTSSTWAYESTASGPMASDNYKVNFYVSVRRCIFIG